MIAENNTAKLRYVLSLFAEIHVTNKVIANALNKSSSDGLITIAEILNIL